MNKQQIVLSVALSGLVSSVYADNLLTSPVAVPTENTLYMTGATAQTPGMALALASICASSSDVSTPAFISLTDGATLPVGKGFVCQASAASTFTKLPGVTGPWILLKNEGGSKDSIDTMRIAGTKTQLDVSNCTVTGSTGTCTGTLVAKPSHFGFSDVKSTVWASKGLLSAQAANTSFTNDIKTGGGQGFGIIVSPALYTLLQTDQGLASDQVPSITKSQYATVMNKTTKVWKALLPNGTAHASSPLYVARRSTSSGTQMAAEIFFLNNPCSAGAASVVGSLNATTGSTAGVTYGVASDQIIVKQEGSSDAVLSEAANSTYAIGVVSLENIQPASSWKYVAIDGFYPGTANSPEYQKKNILNGKYAFAFETYLQKNTDATFGSAATAGTLANNINDFINAIVAFLSVGSNTATSHGLYGDPLATGAELTGTPVNTNHYSRNQKDCAVPTLVY